MLCPVVRIFRKSLRGVHTCPQCVCYMSVCLSVCLSVTTAVRQQIHHVRSLCLNSSRANRIRQSYKIAGQLRRSRSQCTSKLLLRMHTVASSTDDAPNASSNSSNNSSTGVKSQYSACWLAGPSV